MKIALGADHGGFTLKTELAAYLRENKYSFADLGTHSEESCDYPDMAKAVAAEILGGECSHGILLCGTGIGVSIAANKIEGIRAALCHDVYSAQMAREHNNSNVLCLGGRVLGVGPMQVIVEAWLSGSFQGGRHQRRVDKIAGLETARS